ncbi:MAG: epoxyqueuosine reductase QueH [Nitrospiraceae bacterium]|nr:epoxyqueuosine reductase QueH [Nitrospiraceae bacterium]
MLLHICCAPCAVYPLSRLRAAGFPVQGFFYNPNIHPFLEYRKRLETVREFAGRVSLPLHVRDDYDLDGFLVRAAGKGAGRCEHCYRMRLAVAASEAKLGGFTLLSTTLLYSKYQKHDLIRGVGEEMCRDQGIELYYEDFRAGWKQGIIESKAMGLYRQQYCGCIYSERERYER